MPATKFICPNGQEIEITRCLQKCPYGQRCMFLPTLRAVAASLNRNIEKPTFDFSVEEGENTWKIKVSNIQYNGYIDKWEVRYKKDDKDYWSTTENMEFEITDPGNYSIIIANGDITSAPQSFTIEI